MNSSALGENVLQTCWRADWAKKGTYPSYLRSAASLKGRYPTLSLSHGSFRGPGMASLTWTLHLATQSATGRLTDKWERGGRGVKPGEILGQAGSPTTQFHATPPGVQAPTRELCTKSCFYCFHLGQGPAGGSERQGKVCRGFKVIPRTSCLTRHGAAHGSHAAAPHPGTSGLPGGRCTGCKSSSSRSRTPTAAMGLGNSVYQEASSPP